MKFRKRLFTILALLVLILMVWVTVFYAGADKPEEATYGEDANDVLNSVAWSVWICLFAPFLAFFSLMAWRNSVGLTTERRHQEQLEALRQQQR